MATHDPLVNPRTPPPSRASVSPASYGSIAERVNPLELGVNPRDMFHQVNAGRWFGVGRPQPVRDPRVDVREGCRGHPARERQDVVEPEAPRALTRKVVHGRSHIPHRRNDPSMDLPELGQQQIRLRPFRIQIVGPGVHPLRRVRVPLDLKVLTEFLVAHGTAFVKERPNLLEDERVALDCR